MPVQFIRGLAIIVGSARFEPDAAGDYDLLLVAKNGEAAAYDTMTVSAGGEGSVPEPAAVVSTSDVVVTDALKANDEEVVVTRTKGMSGASLGAIAGAALGVVAMAMAAVLVAKQRRRSMLDDTPTPDFGTPGKDDDSVSL